MKHVNQSVLFKQIFIGCLLILGVACSTATTNPTDEDPTTPVTSTNSCGDLESQAIQIVQASDGLFNDKVNVSWSAPFSWQTIDNEGAIGAYAAMVAGIDGTLHAVTTRLTGIVSRLIYATKSTTGCWELEVVEGVTGLSHLSLVVTGEDVYVVGYDADNQSLKLITKENGVWSVSTIDSAVTTSIASTSIALVESVLHVAYADSDGLMYATKALTANSWSSEVVDSSVSQYAKLAVYGDGTVHIVYRSSSTGGVKHASKTSTGSWSFLTVATGTVGLHLDFKLVSTTWGYYLVASYYDSTEQSLNFAWYSNTTQTWATEVVDNGSDTVGWYTSVTAQTVAPFTFHISYADITNGSLKHASRAFNASSWNTETLDSTATTGQWSSMVIDSSNNPHIVYYDLSATSFNYAFIASDLTYTVKRRDEDGLEDWTSLGTSTTTSYDDSTVMADVVYQFGIEVGTNDPAIDVGYAAVGETVDASANVGTWTGITTDSSGTVHISYHDEDNRDLKHAWKSSGSNTWNTETVDETGRIGEYTSIGVASNGTLHIMYYSFEDSALKHAWKTTTDTSWSTETVDNSSFTGLHTDLFIAPDGTPHVSYYEASTDNNLRHAKGTWNGSSWTWAVVSASTTDDVGKWSSLSVNLDNVYIAHYDDTNNRLLLTIGDWNGSSYDWTTEVVDDTTSPDVGEFTSIDVVGTRIHISYNDDANENLMHAWRDISSSSWTLTTVDEGTNFGLTGKYTALVVSSDGDVHIAYNGTSADRLILAQGVWNTTTLSYDWTVSTVDEDTGIGTYADMCLGSDGNLHFSYYDSTNEVLKYTSTVL